MGVPTVEVCRKCKNGPCVAQFLERLTDAKVHHVGCQKVCHGTVVGTEVDGRMEWFERMEKPKALLALSHLLTGDGDGRTRLAKPLAKRRVAKRSGRPPR